MATEVFRQSADGARAQMSVGAQTSRQSQGCLGSRNFATDQVTVLTDQIDQHIVGRERPKRVQQSVVCESQWRQAGVTNLETKAPHRIGSEERPAFVIT